MKNLSAITLLLLFVSIQQAVAQGPVLVFDEVEWSYDTLPEGDSLYHTFTFTNKGDQPLEIEHAKPSCNCTHVEKYTATAVPPGGKGEIVVLVTTQGKSGQSDRSVTVISNTEERVQVIEIKGFVGPPRGDESQNGNGQQIQLGNPEFKPFGWD